MPTQRQWTRGSQVRQRSLSLGRRHTDVLIARACHASPSAVGLRPVKGHCAGASSPPFGARPWCDQRTVSCRVARVGTPLRLLSLGRKHRTQAFCARALCRADCGRATPDQRAISRREASLLRRTAVVRRADCGLRESASFRVACASATAVAVSHEAAQHASFLRARTILR